MTDKDENDTIEKIVDLFQKFTFETIKGVFIALDLLVSHCNSFEEFKAGVKQTVDNLTEEEDKNE